MRTIDNMLINDEILGSNRLFYETLLSLGNGHIGTRGSFEEAYFDSNYVGNSGTYINAFFDSKPIQYGESAYGYAKNSEMIAKLPGGSDITFEVDGQRFSAFTKGMNNHQRYLDMKSGTVKRVFDWTVNQKKTISGKITKMVSFAEKNIMATDYQLTAVGQGTSVRLISHFGPDKKIVQGELLDDPRSGNHYEDTLNYHYLNQDEVSSIILTTQNSQQQVVLSQMLAISSEIIDYQEKFNDAGLERIHEFYLEKGQTLTFTIYTAYSDIIASNQSKELFTAQVLEEKLARIVEQGFSSLSANQNSYLDKFWKQSEIKITGDQELQQALNFNLFHLNQAAGRDGRSNIAAKGLTGQGYEGHYFWDTEMYMLPFFTFTQPEVARSLLEYRHSILEEAKKRAREMGYQKGALYAWRTISGAECSAYYPAGTAQVHINADIAHAVQQYYDATKDLEFMLSAGIEILIETARFWIEFGFHNPAKNNQFCLNGVTGPDEYTALVNNNYYTNLMVKNNLNYAIKWFQQDDLLKSDQKDHILSNYNLSIDEINAWEKAAQQMYLPYDLETKLTKQDDQFFDKKIWALDSIPEENFPLLLHYHPMTIYRYQINKQADTILAHMLDREHVTTEQVARDYDYYEKITTHDSSLSRSIFSIVASDIGNTTKAYDYFMDTAKMDLTNMQGNTEDGIHAANMGGSWLTLIYGFAGLRLTNGQLRITPKLPQFWDNLSFRLFYHGSLIQFDLTKLNTQIHLVSGEPVTIYLNGKEKIIH